jgi:hypothetical protein
MSLMTDIEKPSTMAIQHGGESPLESAADSKVGVAGPVYSEEMEKRILRKMDIRLIPMLATLYLLAFLDRGNIGNAKIEGMLDELHMSGPEYSWCCTRYSP